MKMLIAFGVLAFLVLLSLGSMWMVARLLTRDNKGETTKDKMKFIIAYDPNDPEGGDFDDAT